MVLKAVQPIRVIMPNGPRAFAPGETITLPDHVGQRLLAMAPQQVEVVEPKAFQPGMWCEWWSPLLGHCTGQVVSMTVKGYIVTNHSVIGPHEQVEIPAGWIFGVYRDGERT